MKPERDSLPIGKPVPCAMAVIARAGQLSSAPKPFDRPRSTQGATWAPGSKAKMRGYLYGDARCDGLLLVLSSYMGQDTT